MKQLSARSELPKGVTIESVPLLGTTWYERGVKYWLRRVAMVLVSMLILALVGALLAGFFGAIRASSRKGFVVAVAVEIVYSFGIILLLIIRTKRHWNDASQFQAPRKMPGTKVGAAGAALGTLARSGSVVGQLFLVVLNLLFVGLYVALFLAMLMPETIWERPARLRVLARLREHQH